MKSWSYFGVPFTCYILLADTEALDSHFCERYFQGNYNAFLETCRESVKATQVYLDSELGNSFVSTSFFEHFTEARFRTIEAGYIESLKAAYRAQRLKRVDADILARSGLYRRLYGDTAKDPNFLVDRTIRTLAQYLTLGRLIGEDPQGLVIVHDTVNGSVFQQSNEYSNGYEDKPVPRPPLIKKDLRVY